MIDEYFKLQAEVHAYFGYEENWRILPMTDERQYYWRLDGEGPGRVSFAEKAEYIDSDTQDWYQHEIYTQRHLKRWVYRAVDYTMICCDTHTDGNQLLCIFDNAKEQRP